MAKFEKSSESSFENNEIESLPLHVNSAHLETLPKVSNLVKYYAKFFPFDTVYEMFHKFENKELKREFAFELQSKNISLSVEPKFLRNIVFFNVNGMKKFHLHNLPDSVMAGSIKDSTNNITGSELKFDIDVNLYDKFRTCCQEKNICKKCWKFLIIARNTIQGILKYQFSFKHILWTFSGGRGIHCWVLDEKAKKLSVAERETIVSYCDYNSLKNQFGDKIISTYFSTADFEDIIINDQQLFNISKGQQILLKYISNDNLKTKFLKSISAFNNSEDIWIYFVGFINIYIPLQSVKIIKQIKNELLFPRIDKAVTVQINHLLRVPFSVHSLTQKICLPLMPNSLIEFDPKKMPSLDDVLKVFLWSKLNILSTYIDFIKNEFISIH